MQTLVDLDGLEALYGADSTAEILELYLTETTGLLVAVEECLAEKSGPRLAETAHQMKGSSGFVLAGSIQELSKQLEQAALTGNWEQAGSVFESLKRDFENAHGSIRTYLSTKKS